MAVAGKVAITLSNENDGKWSESVTYDRLTAVTHNNNLYISKKPSTNVEPTVTDEFWFLALKGFSGEDVQALIDRLNELSDLIQEIIDGTTQVGNAKTLDGHEAEYFFPKSGGTVSGNVTALTESADTRYVGVGNSLRNLRMITQADGVAGLRDAKKARWIIESSADGNTNTFNGRASENLPLHGGGTVDRALRTVMSVNNIAEGAKATTIGYRVNDTLKGEIGYSQDYGAFYRDADANNYSILHTGNMANHVLPLTGGTLDGSLILRTDDGANRARTCYFRNADDTSYGGLGVFSQNGVIQYLYLGTTYLRDENLSITSGEIKWKNKDLLHTGNKPTGTYTGNGDATSRTINIGGIGETLFVNCPQSGFGAIVWYYGALVFGGTSVNHIPDTQANFRNGVLTLATDSGTLNGNGYTNKYQVL